MNILKLESTTGYKHLKLESTTGYKHFKTRKYNRL